MSARRWTDAELAVAVRSARSWRGVLRAIGLKATSSGTLRLEASRSPARSRHFSLHHQRTWSDLQLQAAVRASESWAEVIEHLSLSDCAETRAWVKGHALRLGLDDSHLTPRSETPVPDDVRGLRPEPTRLRTAAESIAITWFTLRGVPVAMPTEPSAYDLLATMASGVKRVQVKSGTRTTDEGGCIVNIGHRPYSAERTGRLVPYDPDDVDYFFIVEAYGGLLLLPIAAIAGLNTIDTAAYVKYRVGDASSLLVA